MEIYAPLQTPPKRKTFAEVVNPKVCIKPKRVRIINDCLIRGQPAWVGSVFEFDASTPDGYEDLACLISHSNKAEYVPIDTPLFTAPDPTTKRK